MGFDHGPLLFVIFMWNPLFQACKRGTLLRIIFKVHGSGAPSSVILKCQNMDLFTCTALSGLCPLHEHLLFVLGCSGLSGALLTPSASSPRCWFLWVEDDSDAETFGEENEEQGNYSKRKIVSNWDRYQDIEKEVNNESGESQRGTDFSVLLSSAGDSFSQFRFVEEKEWDGEASCPKQNSAFYVDCESLVRALQELPLSLRLNVAAELVQTTLPLELPQVKPKRNDEAKGRGMQLKGPLGPGGRGSAELKSVAAGCPMYLGKDSPGPTKGSREPTGPLQSAAGPLEEELDLLLSLDAPIKEGENILPDQTSQDRGSEKDGEVAPEEKAPAEPSVVEEKNVEPEQASTSKTVTEEELEDWLDSMIS
ncbi:cell death regulator aven-like [Lynx pardinus]|uniref:Cell death regulator aven-like n=1 Tax=Lynx pardinus TaxID=191816 RepID=A0A485N3S7_LYNPA|nr:cell death regulator aven-like [Lynx pardinus]